VKPDRRALDDLVTFAHLELDSADIEPWAAVLAHLHDTGTLDDEQTAWAVKLYNATDTFGTGFAVMDAAPSPRAWLALPEAERHRLSLLPLSGERRNLRGGRLSVHLDHYCRLTEGWAGQRPQVRWLEEGVTLAGTRDGWSPADAWDPLMRWMRQVWGTGRLSAFEWAEFLGKTGLVKVEAPHGCLWESSGPRESLTRLYSLDPTSVSPEELEDAAASCRDWLAAQGAALEWWDFETVICDFNVMRKGRYYPGRHLGMLLEEIMGAPDEWRDPLFTAWRAVIPYPWNTISPGDRRDMRPIYRDTGRITTPLGAAS
jgi:hypothetical protein